jgi:hypothetical protein
MHNGLMVCFLSEQAILLHRLEAWRMRSLAESPELSPSEKMTRLE